MSGTVRDRTGIVIVESTSPSWSNGNAWTLGDESAVDLGVREGDSEHELRRPYFAVKLSTGRIVVSNTGSLKIRIYDDSGTHLIDVGRRGGGPGEFQRISWMGVFHDSVVVFDQTQRRVNLFNQNGEFVGTVRLEPGSEDTHSADVISAFYPSVGGVLHALFKT